MEIYLESQVKIIKLDVLSHLATMHIARKSSLYMSILLMALQRFYLPDVANNKMIH